MVFSAQLVLFSVPMHQKKHLCHQTISKVEQKSEKVKEHEHSTHRQKAMEQAYNLKRAVEHPLTAISALIDSSKAVNIQRNREVLKSIARCYSL